MRTINQISYYMKMILMLFLVGIYGFSYGATASLSPEALIKSFSINNIPGTINPNVNPSTISVVLPYGTNLGALKPTFTLSSGASVKAGKLSIISGTTSISFSGGPQTFTVTSADKKNSKDYLVTVKNADSQYSLIQYFSISNESGATIGGKIDQSSHTISVLLPYSKNPPAALLTANFQTTGNSVKIGNVLQTSGTTKNNFNKGALVYTVTGQDKSIQSYTVSVSVAPSSEKDITSFSFGLSGESDTINDTTINVYIPYSISLGSLPATFVTTGDSVSVNGVLQTSKSSYNDFTNPLSYVVKAKDNSTKTYTVKVNLSSTKPQADITSFSFGIDGESESFNNNGTIYAYVPYDTDLNSLVPSFKLSLGANVLSPPSTITTTNCDQNNNCTNYLHYGIFAADGSYKSWVVYVVRQAGTSSANNITSFSINNESGTISGTNISLQLPYDTSLTSLVAAFKVSSGASVSVNNTPQTSGVTQNNFTKSLSYIVTAANGSQKTYFVKVTTPLGSTKSITQFYIESAVGVINESALTITVNLPYKYANSVTSLTPRFVTTGVSVTVDAGGPQQSGSNTNDFTNPVRYVVKAADGTTQTYTVTVNIALNASKTITSFTIPGVGASTNISGTNITVNIPSVVDLTSLAPIFTTTGDSVSVKGVLQTSGQTKNNFTSPVNYDVKAADGTKQTYYVMVNITSSAKDITYFALSASLPTDRNQPPYKQASINQNNNQIAVCVPSSWSLSRLYATFVTNGKYIQTLQTGAVYLISNNNLLDYTSPVYFNVYDYNGNYKQYTVTVTQSSSCSN